MTGVPYGFDSAGNLGKVLGLVFGVSAGTQCQPYLGHYLKSRKGGISRTPSPFVREHKTWL